MDANKLSRLLFFLSKNARYSTKELGRLLNISQQTASYTLQKLEKEKLIRNYQLVADPAKFGLINVILLLDYQNFDQKTITAIKKHLKQEPNVTRVEEVSQGADLLVEYCVPNLSYFNKQHKDFLYEFKNTIKVREAHVVIVKHHYTKNYLHKRYPDNHQAIISGDRDRIKLNNKQEAVLKELLQNPKASITTIAHKIALDPKTTTNIKKWLKKNKIIRRYSILFDYEAMDITREYLFINLSYEGEQEEKRFLEFCKQHKNIVAVTKIIGEYDLFVTTEKMEKNKPIINELRKNFTVRNYRIISSDNITKYDFLPSNLF